MKFIRKLGNLKFYGEREGAEIHVMAINGTDVVSEIYTGGTEQNAIHHVMNTSFDSYTMMDIRAGIPELTTEYNGNLVSGKIAGFDHPEYFKRIDSTEYFKHFNHRPMMEEDFQ